MALWDSVWRARGSATSLPHEVLRRPRLLVRPPSCAESIGGYRRVHGELTTLGIKVAPSTIWEILRQEGLDPASERVSTTWADFLRSQADALPACDFIETITLKGQRQYILAIIEHATRRTTAHPCATWVIQVMAQAAPLRTAPDPTTDSKRIDDLNAPPDADPAGDNLSRSARRR